MKLPQEIEVQYIIPALRRELVKELKALKLSQKQIADELELTEAGVSQYLSGKRGSDVKFDKSMQKEIKIAETEYIPNQRGYALFSEIEPNLIVEVFNQKKNKWEKADYHCEMVLHRKKLKTDKKIKITFKPNPPSKNNYKINQCGSF